jgi:hypothetical protein
MIGIAMLAFDDYVIDVLMRDLVGHDRKPTSFLLYLWLHAEQTRRDGPVQASYVDLAESVGVSKSSAQVAAKWLVRRKLVSVSKDNVTATPCYRVQRPWRDRARSVTAQHR